MRPHKKKAAEEAMRLIRVYREAVTDEDKQRAYAQICAAPRAARRTAQALLGMTDTEVPYART